MSFKRQAARRGNSVGDGFTNDQRRSDMAAETGVAVFDRDRCIKDWRESWSSGRYDSAWIALNAINGAAATSNPNDRNLRA